MLLHAICFCLNGTLLLVSLSLLAAKCTTVTWQDSIFIIDGTRHVSIKRGCQQLLGDRLWQRARQHSSHSWLYDICNLGSGTLFEGAHSCMTVARIPCI